MNTIRFFLLLSTLFLFAFVFRIQTSKKLSVPGVLSDKITQQPEQSIHNVRDFFYPHATIVSFGQNQTALTTTDALSTVVTWYSHVVLNKPNDPKTLERKNDQTIILAADKNNQKIVVTLTKKQGGKDVLIVITVTTP